MGQWSVASFCLSGGVMEVSRMFTLLLPKFNTAYREWRAKGFWVIFSAMCKKLITVETYIAVRVDLRKPLPALRPRSHIFVRRATEEDFSRFRAMPYPFKRHAEFRDKFGIDQCYVALIRDEVANICWVYYPHEQDRHPTPFRHLKPDEAALANSVTLPEFRGLGVFPAMLQTLFIKLRDEGYRYCYGYVDARNDTSQISLRHAGYSPVGKSWRVRLFYHKDPAAGIYIRGRCAKGDDQ
jgi:GNAT superfamily N-acetyltransferase